MTKIIESESILRFSEALQDSMRKYIKTMYDYGVVIQIEYKLQVKFSDDKTYEEQIKIYPHFRRFDS